MTDDKSSQSFYLILLLAVFWVTAGVIIWQWPSPEPEQTAGPVDILWDHWGIPHIFANDINGAFYACGYAQMESHGNLLIKLYGESRGRAAEYWGESHREQDILIHQLGIPQRSAQWFAAYDSRFQGYLKSFVKGLNDYAGSHKDDLDAELRVALPLTVEDVMSNAQRLIHMEFMARQSINHIRDGGVEGSNGWAIAPAHSDSGNALLLINPHIDWGHPVVNFEAGISAPGLDIYGITQVGFPVITMGFNSHLGWAHTVNVNDGADIYELTLKDDRYMLDGRLTRFREETLFLKIRKDEVNVSREKITIKPLMH